MEYYKFYIIILLLSAQIIAGIYESNLTLDALESLESRFGMACGYVVGNE